VARLAGCTRKARVDVILTWNVADLERVTDGIEVASPRT
jgi:hypothetical protein